MADFGAENVSVSVRFRPEADTQLALPNQRIPESLGYTSGVDAATNPAVRAVAHCGLLVLPAIYGLLVSWRQSHRTSAERRFAGSPS